MTPTLTALLCLGLSVGLKTRVQAGTLPKPTLQAEPGSLIPLGSPVNITCQGTLGDEQYRLDKEGNTPPWKTQKPPNPGDKATFSITRTTDHDAGRYRCYYRSPSGESEHSDPLELVVTEHQAQQYQAEFSMSPVTSTHGGTYRCYSSLSTAPYLLSPPKTLLPMGTPSAHLGGEDATWAMGGALGCSGQVEEESETLCSPSPPPTGPISTAEGVPKPSIWVDPGPLVTTGSPVTIWCQASLQATAYVLYKERGSEPWDTKTPQNFSNKTGFLIESSSSQHAGPYECAYYTTERKLSERSDPLLLVVTGVERAPSLSAQPSPVVASGGSVSLVCRSQDTSGTFHLLKEGGADPPRHMEPQSKSSAGRTYARATFPVGPVNSSHGGTYRCYGSPRYYPNLWSHSSDPLRLEVTGVHREPSLSAQPGSLVLPGDSLTLQCGSEAGFDRFALTKDQGLTPQRLDGQHSPDFLLGRVDHTHGGRYRCYSGHSLSYAWSAPSAPLDILVTGMYTKPSLSILPGPSVPWGANVTLQCGSEIWFDTFHLHREGSLDPPQHLPVQKTTAPSQANFTISPVTSAHRGTYRCYGSHSASPYLLSHPSDPLELLVSDYTVENLIRMGVAGLVLLVLGLLLFQARNSPGRIHNAART
ncbi:LOW QUALITY PROTEIN: leukocyte immunoglobulin-like receptor subfamily A member 6 [Molossus nigricans]